MARLLKYIEYSMKTYLLFFGEIKHPQFQMQREMGEMENNFCPLLRGDCSDPEGMANTLEQRLKVYVSAVKKTQEDIQEMMTRAEVMSYKGVPSETD